ncbi:MAG: TrkH family potassium uptake protein [Candidatus Altiarchaeota archaeon]|nr:TrkH family potassium uptake protein [Candidatus Altiarchaeota archaeon]
MKSSFFTISINDLKVSLRDLAGILQILAFVMLMPLFTTFFYSQTHTFEVRLLELLSFIIPSLLLYLMYLLFKRISITETSKTKHIMVTFALTWLVIAFVGAIPFAVRGVFSNPLNCFFESMSGWTTTGFSMIEDIDGTAKDILFYRSLMQGVGGLGVISLGLMVLLQGGSIGVGYSDVGVQRIKPGIKQTITEAWKIYGLYILAGAVFLNIAGMGGFDAINFSMTAVATGGFTTHSNAGFTGNFWIEAVLMTLMFLGMTSFIIHYRIFSGDKRVFNVTEFRYALLLIVASVLIISLALMGRDVPGVDTSSSFDVLRKTSFFVISGMSTCGFNTVDYSVWPDFAKTFMVALMYIGGMSSSTAGGIRVVRFVIILKAIHYSLKKLVLPKSSVVVVKLDGRTLQEDIMTVVGYSAVYLFVAISLSLVLMLLGYNAIDSILTIMSSMGNDGLGVISGVSWYNMHPVGKTTIITAMWFGRIEIYAGLLILRSMLDKAKLI